MPISKKSASTAAHRKPSAKSNAPKRRRSTTSPSPKKAASRPMPAWIRYGITVLIIVMFAAGFYWFYIRPYAYRWKPCYGQKGYGVCMPYNYQIHGIDISHYQGNIDWDKLLPCKKTDFPIHFIFMKATEGGNYEDNRFEQNFTTAQRYGFIRGAYHYFIPQTDSRKQAAFFISKVQLSQGDLPPVLDVETLGKSSPEELKRGVRTWLEAVENHYGVKPILYTSYKFKERYLSDSIFNTYPYWIAHYYVDSVRYKGTWHFWQHTDVGKVPGIKGSVDLNVFNGTLEELMRLTLP